MTAIDIKLIEKISQETADDIDLGAKIRKLVIRYSPVDREKYEKVCKNQDI